MHVFLYASYPYKMDYNKGCTLLLFCILCLYAITFKMGVDTGLGMGTPCKKHL